MIILYSSSQTANLSFIIDNLKWTEVDRDRKSEKKIETEIERKRKRRNTKDIETNKESWINKKYINKERKEDKEKNIE